ncbi:MAG: hypothetical protein K9K32_05730 [Halanaerobiales bacterium]|nr:hypothetical protein [Halanaerobiales bacterium]
MTTKENSNKSNNKNKRTVYNKKTNKPRYHIDNAGHQLSNKKVEQILVDLEMHTSLNRVANKNDVSWETVRRIYEKYKNEVNEYREQKRKEFLDDIWDSVRKALQIGNKKMDTTLNNAEKVDKVINKFLKVADEKNYTKKEINDMLKQLTGLTNYSLRDLSVYMGTLIDKHQLLNGSPTDRIEGDISFSELAQKAEEYENEDE